VGNYGVNALDVESRRIQVRGFVVREECPLPSHWQSTGTVHDYLASQGIPGIAGVDTRALTRRLRSVGVMMGTITADETPDEALARLRRAPTYGNMPATLVTLKNCFVADIPIIVAAIDPCFCCADRMVRFSDRRGRDDRWSWAQLQHYSREWRARNRKG
jgi:hypothetical protein